MARGIMLIKNINLIFVLFLLFIPNLKSQTYEYANYSKTAHLNSDMFVDTINYDENFNLKSISWGNILPHLNQHTYFNYPTENFIKCKYALIKFDNDTIDDLYINIRYKFNNIDSSYHCVIPNQEYMMTQDTVHLNIIQDNFHILNDSLTMYVGFDEVFSKIERCSPGRMKVLTFRKVERFSPPQPKQISAIEGIAKQNKNFEIYPTPSNDYFNFNLTGLKSGSYNLEVYNMYSIMVHQEKFSISSMEHTGLVDISALASGVYTVRIVNDNTNLHKLIIIIR